VCIDNSGFPASLERHKIYRVIPNDEAREDGDLRVIDESGESYLYEAVRFVLVDFPPSIVRRLKRSLSGDGNEAR
jgi:hypothetical protein